MRSDCKTSEGRTCTPPNKWGASCLKPVSEFAPLKLKLTSQFGTQKADKFSRKLLRTFLLFELLSEAQNCLLSHFKN
ncbi:hypothetical protein B1H25_14485 (plasmid) [Lactiplantibacillus plantarum]|nr:hypothetical protein B1H25_14485 [Lactiplantibacillus plantarum]